MDQRFNLLAWKALCAVENTGSITDAAAELRTDPSTVSRLIAHLEAALGQTLVRRTERPAMMTQIGREIAKKAEPVLNRPCRFSCPNRQRHRNNGRDHSSLCRSEYHR